MPSGYASKLERIGNQSGPQKLRAILWLLVVNAVLGFAPRINIVRRHTSRKSHPANPSGREYEMNWRQKMVVMANSNQIQDPISRKDVLHLLALCAPIFGFSNPCVPAEMQEPPECQNGELVTESAVPGAYQQVCMALPQRSVTLKATGDVITVQQGGVGAGRTGVAVWNSCLLLTRLLDTLTLQADWLRGKTVLELGCGTGMASIAAAKLGASVVKATDGNTDVIQLARTNLERNGVSSQVEAFSLQWGFMDAMDNADVADIVIGSDLTYNSGTWKLLAETVCTVLKPGGIMLYLSLGHAGFNVVGELNGFLSVVTSEGLEVVPENTNCVLPVTSVSKLLKQCVTPKEQTVLDATGGAQVVVLRKKASSKV